MLKFSEEKYSEELMSFRSSFLDKTEERRNSAISRMPSIIHRPFSIKSSYGESYAGKSDSISSNYFKRESVEI